MPVALLAFSLLFAVACGGGAQDHPRDAGDGGPTNPAGGNSEPASPNEGDSEPAPPAGAVPFGTLVQGRIPGGSGGQMREVVRDEVAWRAAWAGMVGSYQGSTTNGDGGPPAVDFSKEMVIVAAMETQSCVSKVTIRGIARTPEGLVVDLLEQPPAPSCVCITSERPYHAVRLARSDAAVRFEVELGRTDC